MKIKKIKISKIIENEDVDEHPNFHILINSIEKYGPLLTPISVYEEGWFFNRRYKIIDGYWRFKACQHLKRGKIEALVYKKKEMMFPHYNFVQIQTSRMASKDTI